MIKTLEKQNYKLFQDDNIFTLLQKVTKSTNLSSSFILYMLAITKITGQTIRERDTNPELLKTLKNGLVICHKNISESVHED